MTHHGEEPLTPLRGVFNPIYSVMQGVYALKQQKTPALVGRGFKSLLKDCVVEHGRQPRLNKAVDVNHHQAAEGHEAVFGIPEFVGKKANATEPRHNSDDNIKSFKHTDSVMQRR